MPLTDTYAQLIALQALQEQIKQHGKDKQALYLDVDVQRRLLEETAGLLEKAKGARRDSQMAIDALEVKTKATQDGIEKMRIQLNSTKRQAEYDTIRNSILSHQADVSKAEDEELGLLQRVDDLKRQEKALEEELAGAKQELERLQQDVAQQAARYDEHAAQLQRQAEQLRGQTDQEALRSYERLTRSRPGSALVEVKARVCHGCYTTLTKQQENLLMRGADIVYCDTCGRMLMLAEDAD